MFCFLVEDYHVTIRTGTTTRWALEPHRHLLVTLASRVFAPPSFVLFQVHSWLKNVSVSSDLISTYSNTVTGRDVGMVRVGMDRHRSYTWYIYSAGSSVTNIIMIATPYAKGGKSRWTQLARLKNIFLLKCVSQWS